MVEEGHGLYRTWSEVRSGKVVNRSALVAAHHVERAGQMLAASPKAVWSAMILLGRTELAEEVWLATRGAAVRVASG
jgi:hypothetical protein